MSNIFIDALYRKPKSDAQKREEALIARANGGSGVIPKKPGDPPPNTGALEQPGGGPVYDPVAAAQAAANAAGRAQAQKENDNTQAIINALLGSLAGYAKGRDTQVANADSVYKNALLGVESQYGQSLADLLRTTHINEADETAKTFANRTNRARERQSLLEQAASQGAGETDQLRALVQAFENADANQLEVTQAYQDTLNGINSSLNQANSNTENARRNAWGNLQDATSQAWNEYYKNYSQVFTDVQRTAASNNNIDSESSVAFNANFQGYNPTAEATRYVGLVRPWAAADENDMTQWGAKQTRVGRQTTPTQGAPLTRIGGVKAAEGADLRRWTDE